jgi:hypothetical protein
MKNKILREVWHNRDEFAKRCNYDLNVMVKTLARIERDPRSSLVDKRKKMSKKQSERPLRPRQR